jgi:hypothetical protein
MREKAWQRPLQGCGVQCPIVEPVWLVCCRGARVTLAHLRQEADEIPCRPSSVPVVVIAPLPIVLGARGVQRKAAAILCDGSSKDTNANGGAPLETRE